MLRLTVVFLITSTLLASQLFSQQLDDITWEPVEPIGGDDVTVSVHSRFPDSGFIMREVEFNEVDNTLTTILAFEDEDGIVLPVEIEFTESHVWENLEPGEYRVEATLFTIFGEPVDWIRASFTVDENPNRFIVDLSRDWNMVSAPIDPDQPGIIPFFAELVERGTLLFVKDGLGRFYSLEFGFCNIPDWDFRLGYLIKMSAEDNLNIVGDLVPSDTPIPLLEGWNLIAYFPEDEIEAPDAFRNIRRALTMAKDGDGRFYNPEHNFNSMLPLRRGEGYMVKVTEEIDLIWEED